MYAGTNSNTSVCVISLDELIVSGPDLIGSIVHDNLWQQLSVSEYNQTMELKMWHTMSNYHDHGNRLIDLLTGSQWFRGWDGIPLGCTVKESTRLALQLNHHIEHRDTKQIFVYLDGSSSNVENGPRMSWGFCCFRVDEELNHDLFFSSGGIIYTDVDSPGFFRCHSS